MEFVFCSSHSERHIVLLIVQQHFRGYVTVRMTLYLHTLESLIEPACLLAKKERKKSTRRNAGFSAGEPSQSRDKIKYNQSQEKYYII